MTLFPTQENTELLSKVLPRLQRFLSYRERSIYEVRKYLQYKLECKIEQIDLVVEFIVSEGFVDDRRFTLARIRHRLQTGKGPNWISQELRSLGITRELSNELLASITYDEIIESGLLRAPTKLKQLQGRFDDSKDIHNRLVRYLNGRGFNYDHCQSIIEQLEDK